MFSQSLRKYARVLLLILEIAHGFCEKSMLDIVDTDAPTVAQISQRSSATNVSKKSQNGSSVQGELRTTNNSTSDFGVDLTAFHKQRRNGFGNSFEMEENNMKRYFHLPPSFPQHHILSNGFENDLHHHRIHHHDDRSGYHDDIYPVRVQNCGQQYLRDVNRFQNEASTHTNQGIVPGWIGGKSRWRDKNNDNEDKRQEPSTPTYVPITTATAKVPTSFSRYQENRNPDKNYNSFTKPIHIPVKSRLSDSEYRPEDPSRPYYTSGEGDSREYNNVRDSPWTPLTHADRSRPNRIIYYEYNLEDLRKRIKPAPFYSRDYGRRPPGDCGFADSEFFPCDQSELAQSKSSSSTDIDEGNIEPQFSNDVTHFGNGIQHRYQDRRANTNNEYYNAGYEYSLDLSRADDRQYTVVPSGPSPSTQIARRFPFTRHYHHHFPNDESTSKYES